MAQRQKYIKSVFIGKSPKYVYSGIGLTLIGWISIWLAPDGFKLLALIIEILGLVLLGIGFWLSREPTHFAKFSPEGVTFSFRNGDVNLQWHNIQRTALPTVVQFHDTITLDYIGFKFKDPIHFYENIPIRLANQLMQEQKELNLLAIKQSIYRNLETKSSISMVDDITWKDKSGIELEGVSAMFANRCTKLNSVLGFHFYISTSMFEATATEFLALTKAWQSLDQSKPKG